MFIKGLIAGILVTLLNFSLMYVCFRAFFVNPEKKSSKILYGLSSLVRYAVFGALTVVFLKYNLGGPMGFAAGILAGLIIFVFIRPRVQWIK